MYRSTVRLMVLGVGVLWLSSWAIADPQADYIRIFGEKEKLAARSAKASTDFAAELLNAAKAVGAQKDFQVLLCEKAYEFGRKAPAGYATAAEAMKLLIEAAPDRKAAAQEKLLAISQLRYARSTKQERKQLGEELVDLLVTCGDERAESKQLAEADALYHRALSTATAVQSDRTKEIMDKIKDLAAAQEAEKRIAALKARLARDPNNTPIREELILACLGELDDPAEAAKLLRADVNEGLRTYVPLAAKKVEELAEAACLDLAQWYLATAKDKRKKVSPAGKGVLLEKAQACCERYLKLHQAQDVDRLKAEILLAELDKAQGRLTLAMGKGVAMKLVLIQPGKFTMGSPKTEAGRESDEGPQHLVAISRPFYMGVYEVTQAQYEAMMGKNPSHFRDPNNPVENVTWDDAVEFCKKLSQKARKTVRLPTEAQWEYACRAGTKTAYSFGNDVGKLGNYAWFDQNAGRKTHPVGQKKPNPAGLYDMHGNVWECCSDWYADSYAKGKAVDPRGPDSGTARVLRGGSWYYVPGNCRSALRRRDHPAFRSDSLGFRVAAGVD